LLFGSFFADLEKAHFGFVELVIDFWKRLSFQTKHF
jgi:hypothetical protein